MDVIFDIKFVKEFNETLKGKEQKLVTTRAKNILELFRSITVVVLLDQFCPHCLILLKQGYNLQILFNYEKMVPKLARAGVAGLVGKTLRWS